jgi:hypothetical protein
MSVHLERLEIVQDEEGTWFQFAWSSEDRGSWFLALEELKTVVPPEARRYDPAEKVWRVADAFEPDLARIFPDFAG